MRDTFEQFLDQVRSRLDRGRVDFGDRSLERPATELIAEIQEELADMCGWSAILWSRLQRLREAAARVDRGQLSACAEALAMDWSPDVAGGTVSGMGPVAQNLLEYRTAYGLNYAELADLSRVSESRIADIESGATATVFEVTSLARVLAVDPRSFAQTTSSPDPKRSLARFRAPQGFQAISRRDMRLLAIAADLGRVCAHLLQQVEGKEPAVTPLRRPVPIRGTPWKQGYELGAEARERLLPGGGPIDSVQGTLEAWGIHVARVVFDSNEFDAASVSEPGACPIILLNDRSHRVQSSLSRRAVLAHELCHVLHDAGERDLLTIISRGERDNDPVEKRANGFGPSFVAPKRYVQAVGNTMQDAIAHIALRWGFTFKGAAWHAINLNLFDRSAVEAMLRERTPPTFQPSCERPLSRQSLVEVCDDDDVSPLAVGLLSDLAAKAFAEGIITRGRAQEIVTIR